MSPDSQVQLYAVQGWGGEGCLCLCGGGHMAQDVAHLVCGGRHMAPDVAHLGVLVGGGG